ncbi:hypothetical protein [Pseudomonas fulva]|uniref:hypothetical protein n=1 Tax=Pseudomonas fulva TaxID=47880 RepID=UPI003F93E75B
MTEVHRYKVVKMLSEGGNRISYDPHGPEVVMAEAYDQLKAENEALRKQIADLWPLKNVPPQDFRASNKCLACGEYHHGLSGLPCPKMTPVAQAFAGVNQRVVPVEPLRIPHPLEAMAKEASHG